MNANEEIAQAMPDARPAIVLLLGRILIAYYTFFSIGLPVPLLCIVLRHAAVCVGDTSGVAGSFAACPSAST